MTTSGTYAFSLDFGGIVRESWERCQYLGETMKGWQLRSARVGINLMFLDWATHGINLWAVERVTPIVLTPGQQTVTTVAGTIDVLEATISTTTPVSDELLMGTVGRDDYVAYPNKLQAGRPNQYWLERVTPTPIFHLWPVPDTVATYTLTYYRMRQLQDISSATNTADIPPIFLEAVCAGLAARLAQKWVKDSALRAELREGGLAAFKSAFGQDTERVMLTLKPDLSNWSNM